MITIQSSALRPANPRRLMGYSHGLSGYLQGTYTPDLEVEESFTRRSPYDFLSQGGRFDRFGNKSVENLQLAGQLASVPYVDGNLLQPFIYSPHGGEFWVQDGIPSLGGRAILNYGDIGFCRLYESSGIRHSGYIYGAVGTAQKCQPYFASVSTRWNGPTYLSGSWQVWTGGQVRSSGSITFPNLKSPNRLEEAGQYNDAVLGFLHSAIDSARAEAAAELASGQGKPYSRWRNISSFSNTTAPTSLALGPLAGVARAAQSDPFGPTEKSLLARRAIEGLNAFDSNLLAYASDLKKTGDTVRSVLHLAGNYKNPRAWADAWLSGRFGDRLAVADTKELLESLETQLRRSSTSSSGRARSATSSSIMLGGVEYPLRAELLEVIIASNESYTRLMTSINNLMKWDAWPTLENTWDMIPLSFVVDWFLPVQDLLGQIDAAIQAPYIRPLSQYSGLKVTTKTVVRPTAAVPLTGNVTATYYRRRPHNVLGDVRPFDVVADPPSFSVVNSLDAVALLVKTSKRA